MAKPKYGTASDSTQEGPRLSCRGIDSSQRLGCHRYVVERSLAWLVGYRRLQVRYERRADILLGFLQLACPLSASTDCTAQAQNRAVGAGVRGNVPISRRL